MNEQTKYSNNLILDNPISQVIDDNSFYDDQVKNIDNDLIVRNIKSQVIGSSFLSENLIFNSDPSFVPEFSTPIFFDKKPIYQKRYFLKTQRWIGHVIEVTGKIFKAKLEDLNQPGTYEIGEFETNDISTEDYELFKIGSVFYWSVGLANYNGQIVKQSLLRFQRVNNWTETDYDNCSDRASDLMKNLNWEE
jgi:hypothetical protein